MANRPSCPRCPARDYASTGTGICTLNLYWPLNRNSVPDVLAVTLVLSCGPIGYFRRGLLLFAPSKTIYGLSLDRRNGPGCGSSLGTYIAYLLLTCDTCA